MKIDVNTLKICYLFLSIDNAISEDDLLRFREIGKNSDLIDSHERAIISECEQIIAVSISRSDRFFVISEAIKVIIQPNESNAFSFSPLSNRLGQRECLWLLECLSWQDGESSENEKRVMRDLASRWKIDDSMLLEMEDTARTLYEIDNYRSFLETINEPVGAHNVLFHELYNGQKKIIENIFDTINI
jgi:hypothetical protein